MQIVDYQLITTKINSDILKLGNAIFSININLKLRDINYSLDLKNMYQQC